MKIAAIIIILVASTLSACTEQAGTQNAAMENGQLVAERQCSTCHAIGTTGASPRADAPLFRTILSRYRSDVLEKELVENIKIGHSTMPEFQFNPAAVSDLIAYLQSIQRPVPVAQ